MRLSASIMAHPARADYVAELKASLDRDVPVAWAANAEPSKRPEDRWRTGRLAWEMHDPEADYHLVIQDDAVVAGRLLDSVERMLNHVPGDGPISLYLGTKRPVQQVYLDLIRQADEQRASWICARSISWGVAILAPTRTIPAMLRWGDTRHSMAYDMRVGRYYRDQLRQPAWYPWPSLADHRTGPSLVGHDDHGRHAHRHHTGSAMRLRWTGPVVVDHRVARRGLYPTA